MSATFTLELAVGTPTRPEQPPKSASKRRRKLFRLAGAIFTGTAIGYICPFLPPAQQVLCHAAAKIVGFFVGGHL